MNCAAARNFAAVVLVAFLDLSSSSALEKIFPAKFSIYAFPTISSVMASVPVMLVFDFSSESRREARKTFASGSLSPKVMAS